MGCVDVVAAAKALDLFPRTLGRRFDVPASLVGADEVAAALHANPLASGGEIVEAIEVGLGGLDVVEVHQRRGNGEASGREAGVIRSGRIHGAQLRQVAASRVSGKDGPSIPIGIYLKGEGGREGGERASGDTGNSGGTWYCSEKSQRLRAARVWLR